jgi:hypothetical protein
MPLPSSYLTSTKNLEAILIAIQGAKAPPKFTQTFLEGLGFKGNADRLIIGVLKSLGLLSEAGEPTQRYYEFLDQSQGGRVLAEAIEEAYSDLFQVNAQAYKLTNVETKNKLKTLTQGQKGERVIDCMAMTFTALASIADWAAPPKPKVEKKPEDSHDPETPPGGNDERKKVSIHGLQYVINIQLPESRDPAVYDALFRALRDHLDGS